MPASAPSRTLLSSRFPASAAFPQRDTGLFQILRVLTVLLFEFENRVTIRLASALEAAT
jgi:hypothetical protein